MANASYIDLRNYSFNSIKAEVEMLTIEEAKIVPKKKQNLH